MADENENILLNSDYTEQLRSVVESPDGKDVYLIRVEEGVDEAAFCDALIADGYTFSSNSDLFDRIVVFRLTKDEATEIESRDEVVHVWTTGTLIKCSYNPRTRSGATTCWTTSPSSGSFDGTAYIPPKFFWDTDTTAPTVNGRPLGYFTNNQFSGGTQEDSYATTSTDIEQTFDGSTVDIVVLDLTDTTRAASTVINHPDFRTTGNVSRIIPVDWGDYDVNVSSAENNQVTNGFAPFNDHAIACASCAAGTYSGWAWNSNIYFITVNVSDDLYQCMSAIKIWHDSKAVNSNTGKRNATIVSASIGFIKDERPERVVPIEEISSFNAYDEDGNLTTVNRPGGGWGSDYSDFFTHGFQVLNTTGNSGTDKWGIACYRTNTSRDSTWDTILSTVQSTGLYWFFSSGNSNACFARTDQGQYNNIIYIDSNYFYYNINEPTGSNKVSATESTYAPVTGSAYTHRAETLGNANCFYIGALQPSTVNPLPDEYSARGPGIDVFGQGRGSWCASQYTSTKTDSNGFVWGLFSGTSAATPNVVGAVAVMLDQYYFGEGGASWPTVPELRTIIRNATSQNPLEIAEDLGKLPDGTSVSVSNMPAAKTELWSPRLMGKNQNSSGTIRTAFNKRFMDRNTYGDAWAITVTNNGSSNYIFNSATDVGPIQYSNSSNPVIYIRSGDTLVFSMSASGHPMYLKTLPSTGTGDLVTQGTVTNQGSQTGFMVWDTTGVSAGIYYYQCQYHAAMNGQIWIDTETEEGYPFEGMKNGSFNGRVFLPWSIRNGVVGKTRQPRSITYTTRPSSGMTYPRRKIRVG